jgi:hypothetical protein
LHDPSLIKILTDSPAIINFGWKSGLKGSRAFEEGRYKGTDRWVAPIWGASSHATEAPFLGIAEASTMGLIGDRTHPI